MTVTGISATSCQISNTRIAANGYETGVICAIGVEVSDCDFSPTDVQVTGSYNVVSDTQAFLFTVSGDFNRFACSSGQANVTGDDNQFDGCSAGGALLFHTGSLLTISGSRNTWAGGGIYGAATFGAAAVTIDGGTRNQLRGTSVYGAASGFPGVDVQAPATLTTLNDVVVNDPGAVLSSTFSIADGTCVAYERAEWGLGGIVGLSESVVYRAHRPAFLNRVYLELLVAGLSDLDVDIKVNGVVEATATITAGNTSGDAAVDVELAVGDLVTAEVTAAGGGAESLSVQAWLF